MYGTIGRLHVRSGAEPDIVERLSGFCEERVPGARVVYLYRTDGDPHCYYLVLAFESKASYEAYSRGGLGIIDRLARLAATPGEWSNGEVVYEREISYGGL